MNYLNIFLSRISNFSAYLFRFLPLKNKVVMDNMHGRGFGDDPKYIALALLALYPGIKIYWLKKHNMQSSLPKEIIAVQYGSISAAYHIMTSRVWVDNSRGTFYSFPKRKEQFYIQTWHATFGVKKLGTENELSTLRNRKIAMRDADKTDLMYTNSDFRVHKFSSTFWYNGIVEKRDVPRVSFLMNPPSDTKEKVYKYFNILSNKKIILYAPTFRNNNDIHIYEYDFERIICAFNKVTGANHVILVRLHPNIANLVKKMEFNKKVINATDYPDMAELLVSSDILLNDFSSSMFDFSLLHKPVFLLAKDYEDYLKREREVYFKPTDLPFPLSQSEDELIRNIEKFNLENYINEVDNFFRKIGMEDHGKGDVEMASIIATKMKNVLQ